MGLIVLGLSNVWQLETVQTGSGVPPEIREVGVGLTFDVIPNNLIIFVPIAVLLIVGLAANRATAGCCSRSATTRRPRACLASGRGRCWSSSM